MLLPTEFAGRIVQVADELHSWDAISNHVVSLHHLFLKFGLRSEIYSARHDPRIELRPRPLDALQIGESDIAILHFSGFSKQALPAVLGAYCTKVMQYHNITPASYFGESPVFYEYCAAGEQQLKDCARRFHRVWADSSFNLQAIWELGVPAERTAVVPIVVPAAVPKDKAVTRKKGTWLFVGRLAPNKRHENLVRLFAEARHKCPEAAEELVFVGRYDQTDAYYRSLLETIRQVGVTPRVRLLGLIDDAERERLYQSASVYVSMSEHEGFGVPLVEAATHGVPVVALGLTAVADTMGGGLGVVHGPDEMLSTIARLHDDAEFNKAALHSQRLNARRFEPASVALDLKRALSTLLPVHQPMRTVSVIVCTYNRCQLLARLLDYLQHQHSPAFEVIVVDGPSDDGSKELLAARGHLVKLAHNEERNLSKSRNIGIELADGDVVAFIDDDALPFDDWVGCILDEYNSRPLTTAALGGPVYYSGSLKFQAQDNGINHLAEVAENLENHRVGREGWFRYNTGTNATFATWALRELGGFDEEFDYFLDESEVCFRLQRSGLLVGYSEDILVRHEFAQSHNRQGRLNFNWFSICKNTAYFIARHSGLEGDALQAHVESYLHRGRIAGFDQARADGSISNEEHAAYVDAVRNGGRKGLEDAQRPARTRLMKTAPGAFRPYLVDSASGSPKGTRSGLHICIVSREFPPFVAGGGVGTLYYHLASELLLMGHRVTAIVPGDELRDFRQGRLQVLFTPIAALRPEGCNGAFAHNVAWSVSALARLASAHAAEPVDVVDSALWDAEALAIALIPAPSRPKLVVRLVTPFSISALINGWLPDSATLHLFMGAERALIEAADAVVPLSESIAESVEHVHGVRRDVRWHTIPGGVAYWPSFDVSKGYNELPSFEGLPVGLIGNCRLILFVGRLERRKGVDLVLEAAASILSADASAHIVLAGRDVESWASRSLEPELQGRIHFVGEVDDATREKLLARAWCLLYPSRYESFGLVPLEAFVHGLPVVAARAGAVPEVVQDGRNGLLFDSESSLSLAECVIGLMNDPALHQSLRSGALLRVRELSSRRCAMSSVQLYQDLLA